MKTLHGRGQVVPLGFAAQGTAERDSGHRRPWGTTIDCAPFNDNGRSNRKRRMVSAGTLTSWSHGGLELVPPAAALAVAPIAAPFPPPDRAH